jgi:hypothetical protein
MKDIKGTRKLTEYSDNASDKSITRMKSYRSGQSVRSLDMKLNEIKSENEEIRSQRSSIKRESLKLRKLQEVESKKQKLFIENQRRLQAEIENKRKAEKELIERIKLLEDQELVLNRKRYENEMLEKEIQANRKEDGTLSTKIKLLKEKEKLLKERLQRTDANQLQTRKERLKRMEIKDNGTEYNKEESFVRHNYTEKCRQKDSDYPMFKLGPPKIPHFNGKDFEQWEMEIFCLLRTQMYPDYAIVQAIRHSLIGDTRQVLLTIKPTASAKEILEKIREIYGDIKTGDKAVQNFYSATQKEGESCSAWGIRVETLFQKAVEKGEISESKRESKLKERFWRGLYSEKLKNATRVSYESTDTFEKLRRKARLEEEENLSTQVKANINQQKETDEKLTILQELLDRMKTLEADVGKLKGQDQNYTYRGGYQPRFNSRYRGSNRGRGFRRNESNQQESTKYDRSLSEKKEPNESRETIKANLNEKELLSTGKMEAKK